MATPNVGILTTTGKALIDKVNSGQAKISFSKVIFSSMDNSQLSDTQIKALTAIAPQEVVVSSPQTTLDTNSGETRIRATGTNEKLADGVYVKTYGVFAKDDTGNEILYGVTVSPNPNYFPAYDGVTPQAVTYSYKTVIQETSNITMTNSNDVYVSQEDLTEAIAKIPQPDLSGYDKTDDVDKKLQNKQDKLGYTAADDSKVVHTADMRKPASDVAGIEEVNAKQDKIGYTPADDSKVVHTADMRKPANQVASIDEVNVKADDSKVSTLQTQVDNLQVGGQNYLLNSATFSPNWSANLQAKAEIFELITEAGVDNTVLHIKNSLGNAAIGLYQYPTHKFEVGEAITQSVMVRGHGQLRLSFYGMAKEFKIDSDTYIKIYLPGIVTNTNNAFTLYVNDIGEIWCHSPKVETGSLATDWGPNPEEILTKSDDSKVAHLSGANNFDTVPTVNNNPLLLASSLPSDLARTGQDANFTGKLQQNGQNVALVNNTIARNPNTSAVADSVNFTGTAKKSGSDILAQSDWVKSDNDSDAKTASSNNLEGFYYTEVSG